MTPTQPDPQPDAEAPNASIPKRDATRITAVGVGLLTGVLVSVMAVSVAALIFNGPLAVHLERGVEIALITALITGLVVAFGSAFDCAIAIPQDRIAPILAIVATTVIGVGNVPTDSEQALFNVIGTLVAITLTTGMMLFALGFARTGGLIRFMPYSVLAGFFAGTGWLLVVGGLRVMSDVSIDWPGALTLLHANVLIHWLPGVLLAGAIALAARFINTAFAVALTLVAGVCLFYLIALNFGMTPDELLAEGWLLGPFESRSGGILDYSLPQLLAHADWHLLLLNGSNLGVVLLISALSIILTVSGLEVMVASDVDINRELRVAGLANMASAVAGGLVGFHSLSLSGMVVKLNAQSRVTGVTAALFCGLMLLGGSTLIGYLPRIVVGSLLVYLGGHFLFEWLVGGWRRLPRGEYLVIPLILVTIAAAGLLEGLIVGLIAALVHFVLNYSRVQIVRYALSGEQAKSNVERSFEDEQLLQRYGDRHHVLKLRGYLFFGTTAQLSNQLLERLQNRDKARLEFVLIDFEQVNGIDSSANYDFRRLHRLALRHRFVILLTGLKPRLRRQLGVAELLSDGRRFFEFVDLDHALEWCENQLLQQHRPPGSTRPVSLLQRVSAMLADSRYAELLVNYFDEVTFSRGDQLIRQGDSSDDLYFLDRGDVSIYLRGDTERPLRIRRTGEGAVIGELGFYLGTPRSASVIAENNGVALRITADALQRMEREHPHLAAAFHRFMADLLAERLLRTTRTLEAVMT